MRIVGGSLHANAGRKLCQHSLHLDAMTSWNARPMTAPLMLHVTFKLLLLATDCSKCHHGVSMSTTTMTSRMATTNFF